MNIIGRIEINAGQLEKSGDFSEEYAADTRLSGTVELAIRHDDGSVTAHLCHLEMIEVDENLGVVNAFLEGDLERLFELEGGLPETCRVNGKTYVPYIIPFAE